MLQRAPYLSFYAITGGLLLLAVVAELSLGSVHIPPREVLHILCGRETVNPIWRDIIMEFRLPRMVTALLAGIALPVSGLLMQSLFRNPVAGPYILGISSGASLFVAITLLAGTAIPAFAASVFFQSWTIAGAAVVGSMLVLALMLLIARRIESVVVLLVVGLMVGSAISAVVSILQFFSSEYALKKYVLWTFGSLSATGWLEIKIMVSVIMPAIFLGFTCARAMDNLLLGEPYAWSAGVNVLSVRLRVITAAGLLAGVITAFCGPIAFVGIAVPHITSLLMPATEHFKRIPAVMMTGMVIMLFCDVLSQLPGSSASLPINSITALIGAPVVIWIVILSNRRIGEAFQ